LQNELLGLERRELELKADLDQAQPAAPRFHPALADRYRELVDELHVALNDVNARPEAVEILRTLVTRIAVRSEGSKTLVTLTGDIVQLLALPGAQIPASFESSVKVVAGARNRHYLLFHAIGLRSEGRRRYNGSQLNRPESGRADRTRSRRRATRFRSKVTATCDAS
jgi:hypothetical protein